MLDLEDRLDELNQLGLHQRMRMVSGPQGPRVVLDGRAGAALCSGNALGLADHPTVRQAAADAAMRWGVGRGRGARVVRHDDAAPPARGAARDFTGQRAALLFGSGAMANMGVIAALARAARSCCTTSSATPRSSTAAGSPAPTVVAYRTPTPSTSRGAAPVRRPRDA
jgi:glycine C-acetyltransferase/8-amino-7-oxononanoate synthase